MIKCLGLVILAGVAVVVGVPLSPGQLPQEAQYSDQRQQNPREKRSSYPTAYYAQSPCASAHVPTYIAPVHHAAYGHAIPAVPHYGYGLPLSHYREADEQEMMSFSDMSHPEMMMPEQFVPEMDHLSMARYAYGAPGIPIAGHLPALAPAASAHIPAISAVPESAGPAIGVFPGASTGGCSVPLLLTCSPTIRSGRIVQAQPTYGEAYLGVDETNFHEGSLHEGQEPLTHEELSVVSPHDAASSSNQRHQ